MIDIQWRTRVTNFFFQAYYSFRGLFLWFTPWSYTSNMFIAPFVNVSLFALVTRYATGTEPGRDLIIGTSLVGMSAMTNGGILQSFTYEREFGTLAILLASKANRACAYWSRGVFHLLNGIIAGSVALSASIIVFHIGVSEVRLDALILSLVVSSVACVSYALFIGNFTLIFRDWLLLYGASQSIMLSLTGAVIPRRDLPLPLRCIGVFLPLTHGIEAMRAAFSGAGLRDIQVDVFEELSIAVTTGLIGTLTYHWIEHHARRHGEFHE